MRDLIKRLLDRAGLDLAGHDLRRTFATLVRKSSGDEYLAMRLLRDKIPGVGRRYIDLAPEQLVPELQKHSPLTQVARLAPASKGNCSPMSAGGGNALPMMVKIEQTQGVFAPESERISGGDGGGSNSPSRKSCPECATGIVDS